ncbi:MAG: hypothetical protein AAGK23_12315 [Pseudomonadota bacterium]
MADPDPNIPNYRTLSILRLAAISDGIFAFGIALYLMGGFQDFSIAVAAIALAMAGAVYGAIFYFGGLVFAPMLKDYIVSDDTEIKGSNVEMVTTTRPSHDAELDLWVSRFVFARNLFGMAVIPLLLLGGLYVFA